jgi:hypothetical protein
MRDMCLFVRVVLGFGALGGVGWLVTEDAVRVGLEGFSVGWGMMSWAVTKSQEMIVLVEELSIKVCYCFTCFVE